MITYEIFRPGEEDAVYDLVMRVFDKYVAPDYTEQGRRTFQDYVAPARILERFYNRADFILTAKASSKIVGVLSLKERKHISLLFVAEAWQRQGIARQLYQRAWQDLNIESGSGREITVNSSPYAVSVYRELGFKSFATEQERDGIRFIPMKAELPDR